ncbi:helix-turn-helix domain-containing protein [Bacteroides salyersiae]|uniref:helix-turn-helix domain-containing protein n=1 Tax=Bacteroides salyersiae TaxID=291644 RepID=UPI001C8C13C2|nr:helix-turn-helix transcriptional regulator [Bacteroides salyersiae]
MKYIYILSYTFAFLFLYSQLSMAKEVVSDDSLYTREYISQIYIAEPERALKLLDEAENRGTMLPYLINDLRSMAYRNMYMNKLAFDYARKSYVLDSVSQNNPEHLLQMTIALAELSNLLSEYKESMRYAMQGIEFAQRQNDIKAESKLLFCIGENERMLSLKERGYEHFDTAIRLLQNIKDREGAAMLSYFYGIKMGYLMDDSRYDEALAIGLQREKLIHAIDSLYQTPEGYIDRQYAYVYSKLAYICHFKKLYMEAERYFNRYLSTKAALTPDGRYDATPYLLLNKQYARVIDICENFKAVLQHQDTVNLQYLSVLQKQVKAYLGLHDFKKVAELRESILMIVDSMNTREKLNAALELSTVHKMNEKEEFIKEQAFQLKVRNISIFFFTCITVLILFILWRMWRHTRIIKYKNQTLVKLINERIAGADEKEKVPGDGNRNADMKEDKVACVVSSVQSTGDVQNVSDNTEMNGEEQENRILFNKLNAVIMQERLYLSSELSREDLVPLVRMNNARFAKMIKENTGTNLSGYINDLRITHAIRLLKEYPNYTLKAIAEESGFNSMPTFHILFKKKTGMTPFEFKKAQNELR